MATPTKDAAKPIMISMKRTPIGCRIAVLRRKFDPRSLAGEPFEKINANIY